MATGTVYVARKRMFPAREELSWGDGTVVALRANPSDPASYDPEARYAGSDVDSEPSVSADALAALRARYGYAA